MARSISSPPTEFVECGGWSVTYDATGKATISATIVTNSNTIKGQYNNWSVGCRQFKGSLMSLRGTPIMGSEGWIQWSLSWQGIGL
jgi:hypothetical protein